MTPYSQFEHLKVDRTADEIAIVTFAPQQEGDIQRSFFTELRDVFSPLSYDRRVRAVVLTGTDDVFFGGVGRERTARLLASGIDAVADQFGALQQLVNSVLGFRKPLVAAVNGTAHNIGGQIALLCDAAVASERASFGDHHMEAGIAAGDGGTMLWPLLVGMARAREILLLGRTISAAEALELHLVWEVVDHDRTLSRATDLARDLATRPRLAYTSTKMAMQGWWRFSSLLSWDQALAYEAAGLLDRSRQ